MCRIMVPRSTEYTHCPAVGVAASVTKYTPYAAVAPAASILVVSQPTQTSAENVFFDSFTFAHVYVAFVLFYFIVFYFILFYCFIIITIIIILKFIYLLCRKLYLSRYCDLKFFMNV